MPRHPVGDAQRAGQEGAFGLLHLQQTPGPQRRRGVQPRPGRRLRGGHPAQLQGEPGGGPAAAHVVVEVAVERLDAPVHVRGEGDQQEGGVQAGESRPQGQPGQAVAGRAVRVGPGRDGARGGRAGLLGALGLFLRPPPVQQLPRRLVGDVQPAQRVLGRRVACRPSRHQGRHPVAQYGQPGQQRRCRRVRYVLGQAGQGRVVGGHHEPRRRRAASRAARTAATWRGRCERSPERGGSPFTPRSRTVAPSVTGGPASYSG